MCPTNRDLCLVDAVHEGVKPVVCLYDEPVEDDNAGEIKESGGLPET